MEKWNENVNVCALLPHIYQARGKMVARYPVGILSEAPHYLQSAIFFQDNLVWQTAMWKVL